MTLKTFSNFSLPHFYYTSQRRTTFVVTLEVATTTECLDMLYLNSCEICTKIPGNNENKAKFTLERFQKIYIFGVYWSGSLRRTIETC